MIGKTLGEYKVVKKIGQGGMGIVYLAEHRRLQKKYALKVILKELTESPAFIERFHREAQVMAELSHPNIVRVHYMGNEEGVYYLVMEYIESEKGRPETLEDLLKESGGRLPEAQVRRISLQVLDALHYAHSFTMGTAISGIVHRDIKPGNILIDRHGTAKISDFGIARIVQKDVGEIKIEVPEDGPVRATEVRRQAAVLKRKGPLTVAGAIVGSLDYMSPEQIAGQPVDARSDIYSFGMILYQMLTGIKPEEAFLPPPSHVVWWISKKWDVIVNGCLQIEPEKRFQSAFELTREIWSIGRPIRKRFIYAAAAAVLLALGLLLYGAFSNRSNSKRNTAPGDEDLRRQALPTHAQIESLNDIDRLEGPANATTGIPTEGVLSKTLVDVKEKTAMGEEYFSSQTYDKAAQSFRDALNGYEKLMKLLEEREAARQARLLMLFAIAEARARKAHLFVTDIYEKARLKHTEADASYQTEDFSKATELYEEARKLFDESALALQGRRNAD